MKVRDIAFSRSGDKGDINNICVFVYREADWPLLREGLTPDLDVYDAAAWSAPGPLSQASLAQGSAPVKFPDFTRGRWRERKGSPIAEIG